MAFIDNFNFAFQEIILESYVKSANKYGEDVKSSSSQVSFKGIILEKGLNIGDNFLDSAKLLGFTSKDYELYSGKDLLPKKGDRIILDDNIFEVVFSSKVYMNKEHDHNKSILRFIN